MNEKPRVTDVVREVTKTRIETARERAMGLVTNDNDDFSKPKSALDRRNEIMATRMNLINKIIPGRSSDASSNTSDSQDFGQSAQGFPSDIDGVPVEATEQAQADQEFINLIRERALNPGNARRISFRGEKNGSPYAVIVSRSNNRQRVSKSGLSDRTNMAGANDSNNNTSTPSMGEIGGNN